jgi:iron complex transport system ATP-binding protein
MNFSYQDQAVLYDVNVRVREGDFLAIAGPNGSGKSTLLKCIAGILDVKSGKILIDGLHTGRYAANQMARTVAYIPQAERGGLQSLVFDTVLAGRKPYIRWKPSEDDYREVVSVLRLLGIEHLSMKYTDELSGGQQQTVMIARALAQKTRILLLDEPVANLDLHCQMEVMSLLRRLSARGLTIIMSEHNINLAIRYASHVLMLKKGRVLACEPAGDVSVENIETLFDIRAEIIHGREARHIIPYATAHPNATP